MPRAAVGSWRWRAVLGEFEFLIVDHVVEAKVNVHGGAERIAMVMDPEGVEI